MRSLQRGLWLIHRCEDALVAVLLMVMIGLAFTQIVLRNGFDGGILWADSLLRVLVLWVALIGSIVGTREQQHISMDLVTRFLSPRGKKAAAFITSLFTAGICLLLAWYTFEFVKMEYEAPTMAFASVPTWVCEAVMPVAFFLIGIRYVIHAGLQFRSEGVAAP